ncbi:Brp/Blh family beta-carotene 15,15'-dioxygenase [Gammaproteobacteria bacterium]|nr:Brp/Blh family beta-carotene 15,15'-dioxygenase [Gammaproteobacteria bacterium]
MLTILDWTSLTIIMLAGIPHGALDYELIKQRKILKDATFLILYIGLTFLGVVSWLLQPTIALLLFLAITTIHFGRSDPLQFKFNRAKIKFTFWSMLCFQGGVVTVLVPVAKWEFVAPLFEYLGTDAKIFRAMAPSFFLLWVTCGLISLKSLFEDKNYSSFRLTTAMLIAAILLPPLLSFAIYFCGLHSFGHYQRGMQYLKRSLKSPSPRLMILTLLAWISMAGLTYVLRFNATIEASVIGGVFILLFALTLPHMLIIDLLLPRIDPYWNPIPKTLLNHTLSKEAEKSR